MKTIKQLKVFETMKAVKEYASKNYVENGDIFVLKEKPFWKSNPLSLEAKALAKKLLFKTSDIQLKPNPNPPSHRGIRR